MHAISKHVTEKLPNVTLTLDFFFPSSAANELMCILCTTVRLLKQKTRFMLSVNEIH